MASTSARRALARFATLDRVRAASIDAADARYRDSHLMLALVNAQAGLFDEARGEADHFVAENAGSAEAKRIAAAAVNR